MSRGLLVEISSEPIRELEELTELIDETFFPSRVAVDYTYKVKTKEESLKRLSEFLPDIREDDSGKYFLITQEFKNKISAFFKKRTRETRKYLEKVLRSKEEVYWSTVLAKSSLLLSLDSIWFYMEGQVHPYSILANYPVNTKVYIGDMLGFHY